MLIIFIGIAIPIFIFGSTQMSSSDVTPPGIAVRNTPFADIVSDEIDPVVFRAEYYISSTKPLTLTATYYQENYTLDIETSIENALRFIEEPIRNHLQLIPDWELTTNYYGFPILYLWFESISTSSFEGVHIKLNPISSRVVRYAVKWSGSPLNPPIDLQFPLINPDGGPANTTQIQSVLSDFLSFRGYTLPSSMRLLRVTGYPNNSLPNTYKIELVDSVCGVVPPDAMRGITAHLNARTGHVLSFEYSCLKLPETPITQVKKPQLVHELFLMEDSSLSNYLRRFEYKGSFLQFVPTTWNKTSVRINLHLSWTLRFFNSSESPEEYELQRNALDGTELEIDSPYTRYALLQWIENEPILCLPFSSLGVAIVVYLVAQKLKSKQSMSHT